MLKRCPNATFSYSGSVLPSFARQVGPRWEKLSYRTSELSHGTASLDSCPYIRKLCIRAPLKTCEFPSIFSPSKMYRKEFIVVIEDYKGPGRFRIGPSLHRYFLAWFTTGKYLWFDGYQQQMFARSAYSYMDNVHWIWKCGPRYHVDESPAAYGLFVEISSPSDAQNM